jgi:hypothetical protein
MSISKKIRFEVFKRDGFVCQYCGKHPPEATLEVDHIQPVSKKGTDDINNLITSCFDCNRGKTNIELKRIPNSLKDNKEILEERELQYIEYHKILAKIDRRINNEIESVTLIFEKTFINFNRTLTDEFKKTTIRKFLNTLGISEVKDAMEIATSKFNETKITRYSGNRITDIERACVKYFCGICWNKIKNNE